MSQGAEEEKQIEASQAPLISHLIELRQRVIRAVIALCLAFLACFYFSAEIFDILARPYLWVANSDFLFGGGTDSEVYGQEFITTVTYEFFSVRLRIAFFSGLFLASPIIALQLYRFVAPGLYKNERHAFAPFLIATPFLFILGALLLYFVMLPSILFFFLSLENYSVSSLISIEHRPKVSEYINLVLKMLIGTGIAFQLPVLLCLLGRVGLITSRWMRASRKFAVIIALVGSALLTPADPFSMFVLFVPLYGFYEISIVIVGRFERSHQKERQVHA